MRKRVLVVQLLLLILIGMMIAGVSRVSNVVRAVGDPPELYSWKINTTGAVGYNNVLADVQRVRYSDNYVYVNSTGVPSYSIGPWPGNPNTASNQNYVFKIPRHPAQNTGTKTSTPLGPIGVWKNGVTMFNALDAMSYKNQGIWHQNAAIVEGPSFDSCLGHPQQAGAYHHHQNPKCLYDSDSTQHSALLGYAFDGFPVYGAYDYAKANGTGGIKRMTSSYRLRGVTQRHTLTDGTVLTAAQYGPDVSTQYPLGYYAEDYEFISGLGDLDQYNGRFSVTPEYPNGTYAYVVTIDADGSSAYPYIVGPTYYGVVATENITQHGQVTISEPVTTYVPPSATIQFSAAVYGVSEGDSRAAISLIRSGDASTAASVRCATSDGTAREGRDYTAAYGVLNFAAGETSKSLTVLIIDNAYADGARTVNLTLSNPSGATLSTQTTAVLTINDNDISPGTNPVDQARFFVQQHYYDFLSRYPDQSGWDFWTNNISNCKLQPSCTDLQRLNTSAAYFLSIEFQQTGYLVERLYKAAYADASGTSVLGGTHQLSVPIVRFNEFLPDTQEIAAGVVVGQSGWDTLLENNKQAFASEFVQRSRFTTAFPTTMTPTQFVNQLFANARATASSTDLNAAIAEFGSATNTSDTAARARALRDVAENSTLNSQEFNRAFVLMQYLGYLRRNPSDAPDSDYSGFEFWLTKLNQFNGNFVNAEMVKAFITSTEYRTRFGP